MQHKVDALKALTTVSPPIQDDRTLLGLFPIHLESHQNLMLVSL